MRLLDLLAGHGTTPEQASASLGIDPLLLRRIDAGEQPMPADLSARIAALLGVAGWQVAESCPLNTPLSGPMLLRPIPPRLGESFPPARVAPTRPVG